MGPRRDGPPRPRRGDGDDSEVAAGVAISREPSKGLLSRERQRTETPNYFLALGSYVLCGGRDVGA